MPLYLYQAQEVQRLKKQLCALIGDLRYFTPNKNRLTHDRPRKVKKQLINHVLKQKRGLMDGKRTKKP